MAAYSGYISLKGSKMRKRNSHSPLQFLFPVLNNLTEALGAVLSLCCMCFSMFNNLPFCIFSLQ